MIYRYGRFAIKLLTQGMLYGTCMVVTVWRNLQVIQTLDKCQNNYSLGCMSTQGLNNKIISTATATYHIISPTESSEGLQARYNLQIVPCFHIDIIQTSWDHFIHHIKWLPVKKNKIKWKLGNTKFIFRQEKRYPNHGAW